jgi:hypothetical protein
MLEKTETYDFVVIGGGLAGYCAAVAAARHGAKTCLVQDRPVFGGNSSSEVRVTPHGAACFHAYARETGIISELLIEERAVNHEPIFENGWTNSVWDVVLYDLAMRTPGLSFKLNTALVSATKGGDNSLESVTCRVANAETEIVLKASRFADCTGDGVLADLAGCEWRLGSESRDEFQEPHAPLKASRDTMGSSILFKARDMGRPVPFQAPDWAVRYEDASFFYDQGREPHDVRGGFWWIEIGVPWHTIYEAEDIRHELTRHCLGVWDWMKNRDPKTRDKAANYGLDWMGQVPGKRESRRILGRYFMTEHDVQACTAFPDEVAYGGWFVDLHTPGGLLGATSEPNSAEKYKDSSEYSVKSYVGPYGMPLRIFLARDCPNLMMAGRNVSVSHAALGTVRVMATTALMGQAVGTAAALALQAGVDLSAMTEGDGLVGLQQALLRDGCFLPNTRNEDTADLARQAMASASSQALLVGAGPDSPGFYENVPAAGWYRDIKDQLTARRGQWIAVEKGRLSRLSACLSNESGQEQSVQAKLFNVEHIWDYRIDDDRALASSLLKVPVGGPHWVDWDLNTEFHLRPNQYLRFDLLANPTLTWHRAGRQEPGQTSAVQISPAKMRRHWDGQTLSFRVEPPQACYGPEQVLSGVTRPHRSSNLWRSDPAQPLPQWLQLEWDREVSFRQVELTFPAQLFREYHEYPCFYRAPECAKDYCLQVWSEGAWKEVLKVAGNYQRQRKHRLAEAVSTRKLRVLISATNGDPSAGLYEVRCYA